MCHQKGNGNPEPRFKRWRVLESPKLEKCCCHISFGHTQTKQWLSVEGVDKRHLLKDHRKEKQGGSCQGL